MITELPIEKRLVGDFLCKILLQGYADQERIKIAENAIKEHLYKKVPSFGYEIKQEIKGNTQLTAYRTS